MSYVREIVEASNCVFREIGQGQDYGHDAFILLVDDEVVTGEEIAVQVKAGRSYCTKTACKIPATRAQINFWAKHPLTTLGIVYDPNQSSAWWVDLRVSARGVPKGEAGATIAFEKAEWNEFNKAGFEEVLLPTLQGQAPRIDLLKAARWAESSDYETHDIGVRVLLARFRAEEQTWDTILKAFRTRGPTASFHVYRGLVRIMGHPDEGYFSDEVPASIRRPRQEEISSFGRDELIALLHFADDRGFERGDAGYGLFAIVPRIRGGVAILRDIGSDPTVADEIRDRAILLDTIRASDPHWWSLWQRDGEET